MIFTEFIYKNILCSTNERIGIGYPEHYTVCLLSDRISWAFSSLNSDFLLCDDNIEEVMDSAI